MVSLIMTEGGSTSMPPSQQEVDFRVGSVIATVNKSKVPHVTKYKTLYVTFMLARTRYGTH